MNAINEIGLLKIQDYFLIVRRQREIAALDSHCARPREERDLDVADAKMSRCAPRRAATYVSSRFRERWREKKDNISARETTVQTEQTRRGGAYHPRESASVLHLSVRPAVRLANRGTTRRVFAILTTMTTTYMSLRGLRETLQSSLILQRAVLRRAWLSFSFPPFLLLLLVVAIHDDSSLLFQEPRKRTASDSTSSRRIGPCPGRSSNRPRRLLRELDPIASIGYRFRDGESTKRYVNRIK